MGFKWLNCGPSLIALELSVIILHVKEAAESLKVLNQNALMNKVITIKIHFYRIAQTITKYFT